MGWSYSSSVNTDKDRVRFLLQDTDTDRQLLQDEEILWLLQTEANVWMAAARAADLLASKSRGVGSRSIGGLSISYNAAQWTEIAASLRARGTTYQGMSAGGVNVADRDAIWENTDLLRPSFYSTLHQDPSASGPNTPASDEEDA